MGWVTQLEEVLVLEPGMLQSLNSPQTPFSSIGLFQIPFIFLPSQKKDGLCDILGQNAVTKYPRMSFFRHV